MVPFPSLYRSMIVHCTECFQNTNDMDNFVTEAVIGQAREKASLTWKVTLLT